MLLYYGGFFLLGSEREKQEGLGVGGGFGGARFLLSRG